MRRFLFAFLWIAVLVIVAQLVYFVFFSVRAPKYNEGRPLASVAVASPVRNVSALYHDGCGRVWIGTEGEGVSCFDTATNETQALSVPVELKDSKIRSLAMDQQGRLWVGTSQNGLFIRCNDEWKHYEVAQRIPAIRVSPDGDVYIATERGLVRYQVETDLWSDIDLQETPGLIQPTSLAFDVKDNLFVGTTCDGIFVLTRDDSGNLTISSHVTAKRRFGTNLTPNVSPVPLDSCGDGLPSNRINDLLVGSDGTVWAATAAGLAWSRDNGESWFFVRGRDYGEKVRGLLAGTPHGWKELVRVRFGELLPEDDLALLQEDTGGVLWIGTRSLGCVAIKPDAFYRTISPQSDAPESAVKFLEEMASNSVRFHGTKADQIVAMTPLSDGTVLLASRMGSLEKMEYPAATVETKTPALPDKNESALTFPVSYPVAEPRETTGPRLIYPHAVFLGDDYVTGNDWDDKYGKTYALVCGGADASDRIIAFDESLCKIRLFTGSVGNRTRPLERITLASLPHHHHDDDEPCEHLPLAAWSSVGNAVPKTGDGQHLWCEVKLTQPGRYGLSLYLVDPDAALNRNAKTPFAPRDYMIEIYPEPPATRTRIARSDWQEPGRRADEWSAEREPLAVTRAVDFGDGVYKNFEIAGSGTYLVKIDKNYSRRVDLCAVLIDRLDAQVPNLPVMASDQTTDELP